MNTLKNFMLRSAVWPSVNVRNKTITTLGAVAFVTTLTGIPAFADGSGSGGGGSGTGTGASNAAIVMAAAQSIINLLDGFGLQYLEALVAVGLAVVAVILIIAAVKSKNVKLAWTEFAFALVGIVLVLNPILFIYIALSIGTSIAGIAPGGLKPPTSGQ